LHRKDRKIFIQYAAPVDIVVIVIDMGRKWSSPCRPTCPANSKGFITEEIENEHIISACANVAECELIVYSEISFYVNDL